MDNKGIPELYLVQCHFCKIGFNVNEKSYKSFDDDVWICSKCIEKPEIKSLVTSRKCSSDDTDKVI